MGLKFVFFSPFISPTVSEPLVERLSVPPLACFDDSV